MAVSSVCKDCEVEGIKTKRKIKAAGRCATHHRATLKKRSAGAWETRILATYGITGEDYLNILSHQGGKCYICRRATGLNGKRLSVDHDHDTGFVRGILCSTDNRILGHFRDDPELAQRVIDYLKNPPAFEVVGKVVAPIESERLPKQPYANRRPRKRNVR